ncbi:IS3 family transposase, partial [Algiphilus sp. W345]
MMKRPRRNHTAAFKAKVAMAALKGDKTLVELAQQYDVHANQITDWKTRLQQRAKDMFETAAERTQRQTGPSVKDMQAKIGQLTLENDFLAGRARSHGRCEREAMIDREHELSVVRQCTLLELNRSTVYYVHQPTPPADLAMMRLIDELHLNFPFAGSRMLRDLLRLAGFTVGRQRVARLMRLMGVEAVYRRPRTTQRHPAHAIHPYLLRGVAITRPNQVWAMDITYIPMQRGFVYLAVVLDWATRRVLSWRLSISMTADFCVEAVEEAIARYGTPEIFNTDQGSQFTGAEFIGLLTRHGIQISMDGKGCWRDNVFVERLWRSVKYEEVYLHAYESVHAARQGLSRYFGFYNQQRPHTAIDGQTPDSVYFNSLPLPRAA